MRIATITNWAYGITVGLTLASGSAMLMASSADRVERQAVQQRQVFDTLSDEVENDAWALSDLARLYVIKPSPETLTQYQQLQQTDKSIEQRLGGLKDNGASREELALLQDGLRIANELQDEQQAALAHVARGDAPAAIAVLYGTAYETELERMQTQIDRFRQMLEHRAAVAIDQATERSRIWRTLSEIMVGLTALMFLFVLGFILKRRVLYPVVRLSDVVQRLASQDYAVETPHFTQVDEIGDMAQAIRIFRENGLARQRLEQQRDADWAIRELLARMTQRLQGCETIENEAEDEQKHQGGQADHDFRQRTPDPRALGGLVDSDGGAMLKHLAEAIDLRLHALQFSLVRGAVQHRDGRWRIAASDMRQGRLLFIL